MLWLFIASVYVYEYSTPTTLYLGIAFDVSFSFESRVTNFCNSSFAFLRNLYRIRRYLSEPLLFLLLVPVLLGLTIAIQSFRFAIIGQYVGCSVFRIVWFGWSKTCLADVLHHIPLKS